MKNIVVLTGGVGGAKLVLGLARILPEEALTAIVNTGDDFRHLGLHISPDIDTLLYTLAGKANAAQGWGREGESWAFMAALRELGGANWFALGDGDLALHVLRSYSLTRGETLSQVTANVAARWDIATRILPMSDDPVATLLDTDSGRLEFQQYFVERRCDPRVQSIQFDGAEAAVPAPGVTDAILSADAVILAPSNPFLSIDPLLAIPGLRSALTQTSAPIVAVSPLIGGKAVKGPTVRLMTDLDMVVSNESIARHYAGLIDGMVIDSDDQCDMPDIVVIKCPTLMTTLADKRRVAQAALDLAARMRS
ncbi:MAG: 2-phospho-L-lactate transferase [Sphingomonadales bacterium GWF1_63_6]|nr:MAG: 2-phospho-L-lactate transferase [Sphingomonadales bacterium RIFCSPLOWO2_12_FULL_63_15]OHD04993.1 MAG: 2-phospho-L-lactate transferase [Sphingomonadales bacterium GWF1_63_6]|tara:strand:+ start:1266 stop:2192 length:927 start_codon:yes stop_codon:yes gene_type:complete